MPPEFIIIAGPNGTGKSTTSKNILEPYGIVAFDWDKEFHKKWKKFGFDHSLMAINNREYLIALEKIIESSYIQESKVQLSEVQEIMLAMSDGDIKNDKLIDQQSLYNKELEWLKKV